MEHECEGDIVGDIGRFLCASALHNDVSNISPLRDCCRIESGILSGNPTQGDITDNDSQFLAQEGETDGNGSSLRLENHNPGHWLDAFRHFTAVEEWTRRVIGRIGIAAIISQFGVIGHQHFAVRESRFEPLERLKAGRDGLQRMPDIGTDNGLARELLPPAFRLPVIHDHIGVAKLPVVPKSCSLPANCRLKTIAELHNGQ